MGTLWQELSGTVAGTVSGTVAGTVVVTVVVTVVGTVVGTVVITVVGSVATILLGTTGCGETVGVLDEDEQMLSIHSNPSQQSDVVIHSPPPSLHLKTKT